MKRFITITAVLALTSPALTQQLRFAVADATVVTTAKHVGLQALGNDLFLHRIRIATVLKGDLDGVVTIVEPKRVSDQPRPVADAGTRLYCLRPDPRTDLPARHAPYYRMGGYQGGNPVVTGSLEASPTIQFATILIASQRGKSPQVTANALVEFALRGKANSLCAEAIDEIRSRPTLLAKLRPLTLDRLLARAVGETDDIPFKVTLASLCGEARQPGVVTALCIGFEQVSDPRFARAVGRIARHLHGEAATDMIRPEFATASKPAERQALLIALGATRTESALNALLRYRQINGERTPIDAALRAHGSKRALAAIHTTKTPGKQTTDK